MNKLPTAEEFAKNFNTCRATETTGEYISAMLIEFAKLHAEAILKAANEKVNYQIKEFGNVMPNCVLNAYPLTNIK